ncbi:MAG: gamma carbonic anhydrase family protein [Candidatus Thermoplasmatota archaeon]|jgi:carbonic anhydrase/acetyltransferase-like protein (isoleucine patch superfamily)|nr:gamma carbonic anhydrase family protein [Candidatus Thermoplasmatota archaeon]
MAVFSFEDRKPQIDQRAYIFHNATIIGDVRILGEVWVGPGAVIRGDYGTVIIGSGTAVEDNVVIHARPGKTTTIGERVTLGHSAVIHTATIGDSAVIGMHSTITDFAEVGEWAVVAENALVKTGQKVEQGTIVGGVPSKFIKNVDEEYKKLWSEYKNKYISFCKRYRENLIEFDQ